MDKMKFEDALDKLAEMSDRIKGQDTSLEEAIACYTKGMEYYQICHEILENAKQTIETFEGEV
ncbi:MAG: exodeoxyribonuclease VII small subunit [Firmicutes bacterium]|nr:exodeoxyribonuclease VII small subunit [Bacillota bacterium]